MEDEFRDLATEKNNTPALNKIVKVIWSHIDKVNVKAPLEN